MDNDEYEIRYDVFWRLVNEFKIKNGFFNIKKFSDD